MPTPSGRSGSSPGVATYLLVALAAAGLVFAGFGLYVSLGQPNASEPEPGVADALISAPIGVETSPVLSASGSARIIGDLQVLDVDASTGHLVPDHIRLRAGRPAEIRFSQGSGQAAMVVFRALGISVDLSTHAATVRLPALEQGTYTLIGADGRPVGLMVAQ